MNNLVAVGVPADRLSVDTEIDRYSVPFVLAASLGLKPPVV